MTRNAWALRIIENNDSEKDRAEVQQTMLGPEVLDSEGHQDIVFKSTGAEPAGEARVKQTDFGIKPPGKAGVRAKDEVRIEFDVRLAS